MNFEETSLALLTALKALEQLEIVPAPAMCSDTYAKISHLKRLGTREHQAAWKNVEILTQFRVCLLLHIPTAAPDIAYLRSLATTEARLSSGLDSGKDKVQIRDLETRSRGRFDRLRATRSR
jgi:hypothetical protein